MTAAVDEAKATESEGKDVDLDDIPLATVEDLTSAKKPHQEDFPIQLNGKMAKVTMRAIGRLEYDKMITSCPPSARERADGLNYGQAEFGPKLLARVCIAPELTEVQWRNMWQDPAWNRAELGDLFYKAVEVCSHGVNPNRSGIG